MLILLKNFRGRVGKVAAGCAVLLCVGVCGAQDLRYVSQQAWSTEEGLPQSSVHSIVQTRDGYLWIATEGGLARFDGVSFKIFDHAEERAFASDDICCLAADADELWIGTADGVVRMQGGKFRRYGKEDGLPSATVVSIAVGGDGAVTVETKGGGVRWEQEGFRAAGNAAVTAKGIAGPEGMRWSYSSDAVSVAGRSATREWRVGQELPSGRVQTVFMDREGLAWVGMNHGLFVLHAGSATAMAVTVLSGNSVLSIIEDAEGNHWIGTETSGLHVLRRLKFRSEAGLGGQAVTSVAQTKDGAMWVGTRDDGLRRVRNGVVDAPVAENRLTSSVILCMVPGAKGGLWVGTPDGLNYLDESNSVQFVTSANGLPDDYIQSLAADVDGSVWVGTRQGLVHLRGVGMGPGIKTLTKADGLGGDMIGALLLARGKGANAASDLWVGTSGGLSRVKGDGEIRTFTMKDGLGAEIVSAMVQDRAGDLWVATKGGGLSLFDGGHFVAVPAFRHEGGREGSIEGMSADGMGALWFRMDRGIRRIALTTFHACVTNGRCATEEEAGGVGALYGLADGLPNDEVVAGVSPMAWLASDGELWFPTRGGVGIVDTEHTALNSIPTPVVLERFLVDDAAQDLNKLPLKIPFGHARFTMEYAGLSFMAPLEVRYRFRLEGFDKSWIEAGGRRSATYTNLPPGSFEFRVEAMNKDGLWNPAGAEVRFRIVPPFYRRWWFVALALLALCGLLAGLYLLRLRRLRGKFDAVLAERNRMAREIHDTLTQDFVGTSLQLDLISQQLSKGKVEMAMEQVKRTRQLVTEGLDEARRSIWELRANNSQDSLPTRLTRIVERDALAGLTPRLHLGGAYRELEPRVERELLRIAQEALSNALHHAQATEVFVDLHYSSDTLMLTIEDNGVGFSVEQGFRKAGHYGLLGMRERASMIDGALEIASDPGHGTKITLRVPITLRTNPVTSKR
jgi:signal transduction histidine kinase/ligand-binding sensor domain-containing protein